MQELWLPHRALPATSVPKCLAIENCLRAKLSVSATTSSSLLEVLACRGFL